MKKIIISIILLSLSSITASSATFTERGGKNISFFGCCRTGAKITLETEDGWETANMRIFLKIESERLGFRESYDELYTSDEDIYEIKFKGASNNSLYQTRLRDTKNLDGVWAALSSSFDIMFTYFGNELSHSYKIILDDRSINSYSFRSANFSAIPIPSSFVFLGGAIVFLLICKRRRKIQYQTAT